MVVKTTTVSVNRSKCTFPQGLGEKVWLEHACLGDHQAVGRRPGVLHIEHAIGYPHSMPRTHQPDAVADLIQELARAIAEHVVARISVRQPAPRQPPRVATAARGRTRTSLLLLVPAQRCIVPGYNRDQKTRQLCASHYGKAQRLKLNTNPGSAADLRTLSEDGRATRFAKP